MTENTTPRSIRNNNPLNLRKSNNNWRGKKWPGDDPAFEQFTSMVLGIRAAFINARTIIRRNPGCTITRLITIWAPASDGNNPGSYIQAVCAKTGIQPDTLRTVGSANKLVPLLWAMAFVECGHTLELSLFWRAWKLIDINREVVSS